MFTMDKQENKRDSSVKNIFIMFRVNMQASMTTPAVEHMEITLKQYAHFQGEQASKQDRPLCRTYGACLQSTRNDPE